MSMETKMSRRGVMAAAGALAAGAAMQSGAALAQEAGAIIKNGRINQSASRWCYSKLSMDELCQHAKRIGLKALDLLNPGKDFETIKKYGLACSMVSVSGTGIPKGFNRKENHAELIEKLKVAIDATSEAGFPNVICFSGNRHKGKEDKEGVADEEGIKVCTEGLKQIVGYAEQKKIILCMELLNSKRNHKDYQCDLSAWGVKVCKAVGSENFKLLYDIYHMQIDEGDVIATIKENYQYFGHYHTGGVPGRNEIDETQELYYPAIMRAIVATGYKGYVAHEFVPKRDPVKSLEQAAQICDV
jgi:hydroxypyruvate isomerase